MTWRANLQSPQFFSQVPYGRHSPIPLAGPEQRREQAWTPALLAFPWHRHRACPAHCQMPTLGQRTQQPLPTWVWQQPAAGYRETRCIEVGEKTTPKNLLTRWRPQHGGCCRTIYLSLEQLWLRILALHSLTAPITQGWSKAINQSYYDASLWSLSISFLIFSLFFLKKKEKNWYQIKWQIMSKTLYNMIQIWLQPYIHWVLLVWLSTVLSSAKWSDIGVHSAVDFKWPTCTQVQKLFQVFNGNETTGTEKTLTVIGLLSQFRCGPCDILKEQ